MDITIKELSEELGITKQAIRKHLTKLPKNLHTKKDGNTILLPPAVADFIRKNIQKSLPKKETSAETMALIKQMAEKDSQIAKLQTLLDQQQQLTLQSNNRADKLELELKALALTEDNQPEHNTPDTPSKASESKTEGFWSRLFNNHRS